MTELTWAIIGILIAVALMAPAIRILLRRAELRARQAERRARGAERLAELGSMTSGLAHEIKNPLSTIGLNAQLLRESLNEATLPDEERQRLFRRLDSLSREAERLRGILTDFLQFAGRIHLDAQPHDVSALLEDLADFFHPQCDQHGVLLRTQTPSRPIVIPVDQGLLKQALLNLMLNSVQAMSAAKGVEVGGGQRPPAQIGELMLRLEADAIDEEICIHVTDTGPGIPREKLEEIFRPYVSGKRGGTGLGLATARRIVEEHGGRLEAHSEVGRGSDFVIHLPRAGRSRETEGSAQTKRAAALRRRAPR